MSNKKSTVALYKKRKTFKNIFIKYWLIILIIVTLIYILGLTIFAGNEKMHIRNCFYDVKNHTIEYVNSHILEKDVSNINNNLKLLFCSRLHAMGIPSLLYDKSTGEIIAGCEEHIFLIRTFGEKESKVYAYPTNKIPGWTEHYQQLETHCNLFNYTGEDLNMSYYYTNGTDFIPDKFTTSSYTYGLFFDYDIVTTDFDVPSTIPEGYEKYAYSRDECLPSIACGYHQNSPNFHPLYMIDTTVAYNFLMETYKSSLLSDEVSSLDDINESTFALSMSATTEITDNTGRRMVLINAVDYNVISVYKTPLIIIAILLIIFSLVLAFLLSRASYARIKAGYDMEDYRKTLINTMAHDLKSPLMSISGYAENLLNNVHSEKREHYSNAILDNVNHMNQIIESVLSLSKTENSINLTKETLNVTDLINECVKKYELQINEKNLHLEITGNITLEADGSLFSEVLDNLIGNAVKYAATDTTISIILDEKFIAFKNKCAEKLDVDVSVLCQPFVTGNASRSNKAGSGLGLAIVKNICDLHDFVLKLNCEDNCFNATIHISKTK